MGLWIISIILVLVVFGIYKLVNILSSALLPNEIKPFRDTLKGASILDATFKSGGKNVINVVSDYEKMCVTDVLEYKGDTNLPEVVGTYARILHGITPDPEAKNAPSEYIGDFINPDYPKYLKAQKRVLSEKGYDIKWFTKELVRVNRAIKEKSALRDFILTLLTMGLDYSFVQFINDPEKMEKFSSSDWRALIDCSNDYKNKYNLFVVGMFLYYFNPSEIEQTPKMDFFNSLIENRVPPLIAVEIVRGNITRSQFFRILTLVDEKRYSWEEAIEEVVTEDSNEKEAEKLVKRYQLAVARGVQYLPKKG